MNKFQEIKYDFKDEFKDNILYYFKFKTDDKNLIQLVKDKDDEDFIQDCFQIVIDYDKITKDYATGVYQYITSYDGILEMGNLSKEEILDVVKYITE